MPTYQNNSEERITFPDKNYLEWEPGESKALPFFLPYKQLGLTITDPRPYVLKEETRGLGYEEFRVVPGAPCVVELPYAETVELSVLVPSGEVRMYVGDCEEPIRVDPANNHVSRYAWDMSAYLTFEADVEAVVFIKIEPFTAKGV